MGKLLYLGEIGMRQFNNEYRLFFKKLTYLEGKSISSPELKVMSFNLERDLLTKTTSSFEVLQVAEAVENGDIVGMYDSFGTILFLGVVTFLETNRIEASQIYNIFDDNWLWNNPRKSTLEETLKTIIVNDYQNSNDTLLNTIFDAFAINTISSTNQYLYTEENHYVTNFASYLYGIYEKYSIMLDFNIPFEERQPSIDIGIHQYPKLTISNNVHVFRNFQISTNIFETNKLVIYSESTGDYRTSFYATTSGIVDDPSALNRLQKINTNIVFSDEDVNIIKASSLRNQMYNHEITCELVINNKLLPIDKLKLGQEADIYYNGAYFNSILTGYSLSMTSDNPSEIITLKFGLVRTDLTSKLFKRLA